MARAKEDTTLFPFFIVPTPAMPWLWSLQFASLIQEVVVSACLPPSRCQLFSFGEYLLVVLSCTFSGILYIGASPFSIGLSEIDIHIGGATRPLAMLYFTTRRFSRHLCSTLSRHSSHRPPLSRSCTRHPNGEILPKAATPLLFSPSCPSIATSFIATAATLLTIISIHFSVVLVRFLVVFWLCGPEISGVSLSKDSKIPRRSHNFSLCVSLAHFPW